MAGRMDIPPALPIRSAPPSAPAKGITGTPEAEMVDDVDIDALLDTYVDEAQAAPSAEELFNPREVALLNMVCRSLPPKDAEIFMPRLYSDTPVTVTSKDLWQANHDLLDVLGRMRRSIE